VNVFLLVLAMLVNIIHPCLIFGKQQNKNEVILRALQALNEDTLCSLKYYVLHAVMYMLIFNNKLDAISLGFSL